MVKNHSSLFVCVTDISKIVWYYLIKNRKENKMTSIDLWEFKYHPRTFDEMILHESIKPKLKKALVEIPNMILSGSPGIGKGTFVDILLKSTKCEYMRINGSDETGVDSIRDKVRPFATSVGFSDSINIMYINEGDYLSNNAQAMLRDLMEQVQDITRFIFAVNYHDKIIPELKSRCQFIHFPDPPLKDIAKKCIEILKAEKIKFEVENVLELCKKTYPDIRHTINTLKENCYDGKLRSDLLITSTDDIYHSLVKIMKTKDPSQVRRFLRSNPIDYTRMYNYLYEVIMDSENEIFSNDSKAILYISEAAYRSASTGGIKEINFMWAFMNMLKDGIL